MQHYAVFNEQGKPIAFYNSAVHGAKTRPTWETVTPEDIRQTPYLVWGTEPNPDCRIPPEAVEITEDQWLTAIGAKEK